MTKAKSATTRNASAPAATPPAVVHKSRRLEIRGVSGKTEDRLISDMLVEGIATNATTAIRFVGYDHDELSLTDMVASLKEQGQLVNRGDLSAAERMLSAQAMTLNAMFAELARRAALNMGQHLDAMDRYMRLALKAQSQSRATVETLAAIKNPPVVFARQANINNGGQQQVNNGPVPNGRPVSTVEEQGTPTHAHPGGTASKPNELLEESADGRTQLDTRATPATGRAHQDVATVGAVNRAANT